MKGLEIIIVRESAWQSLISDAGTCATFLVLVGIGLAAGSDALQWAGMLMASLFVIARSTRSGKRLSVEEAKARLAEIEGGSQ